MTSKQAARVDDRVDHGVGRRAPTRRRTWLLLLEAFLAVQAVYGGISLGLDAWHLDRAALERLPWVDSWVLPGVALVVVVALPMLTAAWLEWWRHPQAPQVSFIAGCLLVGWIVAQLVLIPSLRLWLQPVCLGAGALVAVAAARRLT
jgi:hypothetical protein